jgi:hypothetical protein
MGRARGLDSRTAAMVAGELLLIQRYLVHLPAELSHAYGKASLTGRLAGRASLPFDGLRSQLENRLARCPRGSKVRYAAASAARQPRTVIRSPFVSLVCSMTSLPQQGRSQTPASRQAT